MIFWVRCGIFRRIRCLKRRYFLLLFPSIPGICLGGEQGIIHYVQRVHCYASIFPLMHALAWFLAMKISFLVMEKLAMIPTEQDRIGKTCRHVPSVLCRQVTGPRFLVTNLPLVFLTIIPT